MATPTLVRKPSRIQFDHKDWNGPAINRTVNRIQDALASTLDELVRRANNPGTQVVGELDVVSGALPIGASASAITLGGAGTATVTVGGSGTTALTLGVSGTATTIPGALTIRGAATGAALDLTGALKAASLDAHAAGALTVGAATASSVDLGASGAPARVYGTVTAAMSSLAVCSASYNTSTSQSLPNNVETIVNFANKEWDTHNAVTNPGTSWRFTVPAGMAGLYSITVNLYGSVAWTAAGQSFYHVVRKNGLGAGSRPGLSDFTAYAAATIPYLVSGTVLMNLAAGDYIEVLASQGSGSTAVTGILNNADNCKVQVHRISGC